MSNATLDALHTAGIKAEEYLTEINCGGKRNGAIAYIVLHYVGAPGGAMDNARFYHSSYRGASAHYFVNFDGSVVQVVPDCQVAWHCGTRGDYRHPKCRNANSIGIEMCVRNSTGQTQRTDRDAGWYFEESTVRTAQLLTAILAERYNIPADHILRHYDVTGKCCPAPYCNGQLNWSDFLAGVFSGRSPAPTPAPALEAPPLTDAQFSHLMERYLAAQGALDRSPWAKDACQWAIVHDLVRGDGEGHIAWHRFATLEQVAIMLRRFQEHSER